VKAEPTEGEWLAQDNEFSLAELAKLTGMSQAELFELVDYGALIPINPDAQPWAFNGKCLMTVHTASRLRLSFDLESRGVALIVSLLDRICQLETQIRSLRVKLPHHVSSHAQMYTNP